MNASRWAWLPNVVGFQIVWIAAVAGAARGWWWAGPLALVIFASIQLTISRWRAADFKVMLVAAVLGFAIDSLWVQLGWIQFQSPQPWTTFAPIWIVAMWMGFALTLNHSLSALKAHPVVAVVFGLIGGPLAYWIAASVWHAATIEASWLPYVGLALSWALVTPLLLRLAQRLMPSPAVGAA
ncbi:MAG: DUF2878 domain-containing protein [Pseudomarimonas sp.]